MGRMMEMRDGPVAEAFLLVSRLLLALIFVHEGMGLAANFDIAAAAMAKMGVPTPALVLTIALQLGAGIAIIAGWHARPAAAGLGVFCLMTAALFHRQFAIRNELLHFEKDLAIAGGMFALMVRGAGSWSLDRMRQANRRASGTAAVVPAGQTENLGLP